MTQLPPLKAVIAFEACYRLRSFTRAASSLNVGQPAVSHQIRKLEDDLKTRLFVRRGARIDPTPEADEFFLAVSSGLSEIARAGTRLREAERDETVTLATYPGIAAFWLLPRLSLASDTGGRPPVRVTTADRDADIPLDEVDCAILFGDGTWPGAVSRLLVRETVFAVAAPALAERWRTATPDTLLAEAPLIHLEDAERRWFTWTDWRDRFAPNTPAINAVFTVTNHGVAIQEALLGTGIALGWSGVIDDLIHRGALKPLDDRRLTSKRGYYLVTSSAGTPALRHRWLEDVLIPGKT